MENDKLQRVEQQTKDVVQEASEEMQRAVSKTKPGKRIIKLAIDYTT